MKDCIVKTRQMVQLMYSLRSESGQIQTHPQCAVKRKALSKHVMQLGLPKPQACVHTACGNIAV